MSKLLQESNQNDFRRAAVGGQVQRYRTVRHHHGSRTFLFYFFLKILHTVSICHFVKHGILRFILLLYFGIDIFQKFDRHRAGRWMDDHIVFTFQVIQNKIFIHLSSFFILSHRWYLCSIEP